MKKLFILPLALFLALTVSVKEVSASTESITWTCVQIDTNQYEYRGTVDLLEGIKSITVGLPADEPLKSRAQLEIGSSKFTFKFYNNMVLVKTLFDTAQFITNYTEYIVDPTVDNIVTGDVSRYVINFSAYDMPETDQLLITVPVTLCDGPLQAQFDQDSTYSYTFDELDYGRIAWGVYPDFLPVEGQIPRQDKFISNFIEIPSNTQTIDLNLSIFDIYGPQDVAWVYYYDENKNLVFSDKISNDTLEDAYHDWNTPSGEFGTFSVAWTWWGYNISNEVSFIRIEFYTFNNDYSMFNTYDYPERYLYYLDNQGIIVNFIIDGEIIKTRTTVEGAPTYFGLIVPTVQGKTFSTWIDQNGNPWSSGVAITTDMISGGIVNLYGVYTVDPITANPDATDPTADGGTFEILGNELGFNDPAERVVIWVVIVFIATLLCAIRGLPIFYIMVVDGIITAFFMSLGLLPTFVSAIIVIVLLFLGYLYLKGGGALNE